MKTLAIYPFSKDFCPLARYAEDLHGYTITALLAPKSFGLEGMDAGEIDGGGFIGMTVTHPLSDELPYFTDVLIDYHPHIKNPMFYQDVICNYRKSGKKILLTRTLVQFLGEEYMDMLNTHSTEGITVLGSDTGQMIDEQGFDLTKGLNEIDVPVITILGTGHQTNKFELQLAVRRYFTKQGYKVCQWGTKDYSPLFGFPALPAFIKEPLPLTERILGLNHLIHRTVEKEKPDLVILGAPGGIMKYNRQIVNDFAEQAYIIANAARADISVLSAHHITFDDEYFTNMQNYCHYKLDCDVRYFNIANCSVSPDNIKRKLSYLTLDTAFVMKQLDEEIKRKNDKVIFNVFDKNAINLACTDMESQLAGNAAVI